METKSRTRILCVDDEPKLLEGLLPHLRRRYEVDIATSGEAALEILRSDRSFAAILSDMRMPGMDGAAFLAQARQLVPVTVRILLTGQADLTTAISAVNEGQIFRFLTKPCPPPTLVSTIDMAVEQHRLITAERVLLEQTLHGSIKTLTDVLALTNPVSFGRATRIKQHVSDLAVKLGLQERWQVEVAAMLSQLGCITLPAETVEKLYYGRSLSDQEQQMVGRLPVITEQLLGNIPRLEVVSRILATYTKPLSNSDPSTAKTDPDRAVADRGAQILRVAADFDALETQGSTPDTALDTMRGRSDRYHPEVLEALLAIRGRNSVRREVREVQSGTLRVGMVLAEDVKLQNGALLVARGYEVTHGFIARIRNFTPGMVREPVRIFLRIDGKDPA